jgi:hypothetical protein
MLVAAVEVLKLFLVVLPEQVVPEVVVMVVVLGLEALELLIAVAEEAADLTEEYREILREAQAALASSSSRPINNEDKWKPKFIGCMESTPQCTC